MSTYLLFGIEEFYPNGGFGDVKRIYHADSDEQAIDEAKTWIRKQVYGEIKEEAERLNFPIEHPEFDGWRWADLCELVRLDGTEYEIVWRDPEERFWWS